MKTLFGPKVLIGLIFFCLGFLTNHFLSKISYRGAMDIARNVDTMDHIPVNPEDFDHDKLLRAAQRMLDKTAKENVGVGIIRSEDAQNVYYEIPLSEREIKDRELKVSVKNGMISISESTKNTQSVREFSIEPNLDEAKATVQTSGNVLKITIPKKLSEI